MQQTETYKLNLIETSDPFSPNALNENTRKVEEVMRQKMEGPVAELDSRVTMLEARKIYFGTITGSGAQTQFVNLGYTPIAVILNKGEASGYHGLLLGDNYVTYAGSRIAHIVENGIEFYTDTQNYNQQIFNQKGVYTWYIAFV